MSNGGALGRQDPCGTLCLAVVSSVKCPDFKESLKKRRGSVCSWHEWCFFSAAPFILPLCQTVVRKCQTQNDFLFDEAWAHSGPLRVQSIITKHSFDCSTPSITARLVSNNLVLYDFFLMYCIFLSIRSLTLQSTSANLQLFFGSSREGLWPQKAGWCCRCFMANAANPDVYFQAGFKLKVWRVKCI